MFFLSAGKHWRLRSQNRWLIFYYFQWNLINKGGKQSEKYQDYCMLGDLIQCTGNGTLNHYKHQWKITFNRQFNTDLERKEHGNLEWRELYPLATKCGLNGRLRYFHLHILLRILITRRELKLYNRTDDDRCNECGECETISHMLYY